MKVFSLLWSLQVVKSIKCSVAREISTSLLVFYCIHILHYIFTLYEIYPLSSNQGDTSSNFKADNT